MGRCAADEARGQHLLGLDIGLPLDAPARAAAPRAGRHGRPAPRCSSRRATGAAARSASTSRSCALGLGPDEVTGAILLTAPVDGAGPSADGDGGAD